MKNLIIIILAVLVVGLYMHTEATKDVLLITGEFILDKAQDIATTINN